VKKTIIKPEAESLLSHLREVFSYRELIWSLSLRDLRVKYAQTVVGFLWAIIVPIVTLLILNVVFGKVMKVNTGAIPHLLFTMSGLVVWNYFASLVSDGANSLLSNQAMIKKIYFPRLVIPISKAVSGLVDFGVNMLLLIGLMIYYQIIPSANLFYLPLFIILIIILGLTGAIWISALTVRYRDFKFVTPFILQIGLYASPIAYSIVSVPDKYLTLFQLNPMSGIIEGVRWSLFGSSQWSGQMLLISIAYTLVLFLIGLFYFTRVENVMADII
jgi:lipopolysaccharide transport system permease protein